MCTSCNINDLKTNIHQLSILSLSNIGYINCTQIEKEYSNKYVNSDKIFVNNLILKSFILNTIFRVFILYYFEIFSIYNIKYNEQKEENHLKYTIVLMSEKSKNQKGNKD